MKQSHAINQSQIDAVPWKNGAGLTKNLMAHPKSARWDNFYWRVSLAEIHQATEYSVFEGVDRSQVLIKGEKLLLQNSLGTNHQLAVLQFLSFPGEQALSCDPLRSTCHVLNIMTRRACFSHAVKVVRGDFHLGPNNHFLFVARGGYELSKNGQSLLAGDFLELDNGDAGEHSFHANHDAVMIVISLIPK